jgi:hypothetical protein
MFFERVNQFNGKAAALGFELTGSGGQKTHVRRQLTVWAGNRVLRSNDPCPNCGGEKPHKGR